MTRSRTTTTTTTTRPTARTALTALALLAAFASSSCRCDRRPPVRQAARPDAAPPPANEDEDPQPRLVAAPARPDAPRCVLEPTRWLIPVGSPDAGARGSASELEGPEVVVAARGAQGEIVAWLDRAAGQLVLARAGGAPLLRDAVGEGEPNAPVLAVHADHALIATVVQRRAARAHRVSVVRGDALAELFTTTESNDDSLALAAVATASGVLIAWDQDRAGPDAAGAIVAQLVPPAALSAAPGARVPQPAPRELTPPEHDAGDPVLVPMPNGTAALIWLAAQDLDASVANQTAADIYVRLLGADGTPGGVPVQITPGPANRFGVAAIAHADALWVAYRVAGDSDQESRGDGGRVAIVRLGPDLHPTASPAYLTALDATPSGQPVVVPDGRGVTVFWTERRGDGLATLRRPVEPNGTLARPAHEEPAFDGALPAFGDASRVVAIVRGPSGEPGLATARCPPVSVAPAGAQGGASTAESPAAGAP